MRSPSVPAIPVAAQTQELADCLRPLVHNGGLPKRPEVMAGGSGSEDP
jgi:hypothetical protein